MIIPTLRTSVPNPRAFDNSTCFTAGHLVDKNAGWRQMRPFIDADACVGCLRCYLYCPDGAIRKTHAEGVAVAIDLDFCKGCGICATMCKPQALTMVLEVEALAAEGEGE